MYGAGGGRAAHLYDVGVGKEGFGEDLTRRLHVSVEPLLLSALEPGCLVAFCVKG